MPVPQVTPEVWTPAKILALRTGLGLTQIEFGEKVYAVQRTIKRWEAGDTAPRGGQVTRLNELFRTMLTFDQAKAVLEA